MCPSAEMVGKLVSGPCELDRISYLMAQQFRKRSIGPILFLDHLGRWAPRQKQRAPPRRHIGAGGPKQTVGELTWPNDLAATME